MEPRVLATSRKRKGRDVENEYGSTDSDDDDPRQGRRADSEPPLRRTLERLGWPHILCLQEVKIKRGGGRTMDAVRAATLQDGGPAHDVHFNLPYDLYNAKGFGGKIKIYGVASVVQRRFARAHINTVRDVLWDKEGRVQIIEARGLIFPIHMPISHPSASPSSKQSPTLEITHGRSTSEEQDSTDTVKFAIVNVYAVNGTSKLFRFSEGSVTGTRHDRKLTVHFELLREARRLEERGFAVVVAGDVNVAAAARREPERWEGEELMGFNGIEAFRSLLLDAGVYDNPRDRGPSDHWPIWAEFGRELE
ncbi:hypothetical protein CHU98_g2136 [Xylaria longipes]|nr:hypothetical protein CHU98_g2136 [Xylaria longipes]